MREANPKSPSGDILAFRLTEMGFPSIVAPCPLAAQNIRLLLGSYTTPTTGSPLRKSPIDTAKIGKCIA